MAVVTGMNIGLFEDRGYRDLLPLTWLRPACELRCGTDRLIDKVRTHLGGRVARLWLRELLREAVAERLTLDAPAPGADWCLVNARAMITADVRPPEVGTAWLQGGTLVAVSVRREDVDLLTPELFLDEDALQNWLHARGVRPEHAPDPICLVSYPWDLVLANRNELLRQCRFGGEQGGRIYPGAHLLNEREIYVAPGARVKPGVVLDAEEGPIHIDRDACIQPNAVLVGPCYIGAGTLIRPGAVIRENTTIGPVCKVGGEVEDSIIQGYSNKQHDGFLGHSYVAEWVNLGADTVTSDLKNTYGTVRVYVNGVGVESGQHFIGAIIGDHTKTGIGTILPTGGILGVAANVFTQAAVPRFVPSFAWLTDAGLTTCRVDKAVHIAQVVMARRDVHLSDAQVALLRQVAELARDVEAAGWA
jgi:UDP-N-acetylglucosamine diphosphorylase/glucosamine-1-phosphate N-acetyltransferase